MGSYISYLLSSEKKISKYGWMRDSPDYRDYTYEINLAANTTQTVVDLRANCPGIYNQLYVGASTSNTICALYEYKLIELDEESVFIPSRLFLYYNERCRQDTLEYDSGSQLRIGLSNLNTYGVCAETDYPYDIRNTFMEPDDEIYTLANTSRRIKYYRVARDLDSLRTLIIEGEPFIFGFSVYSNFDVNIETSPLTTPTADDNYVGGHCGMCVGFNDSKKVFIIRNSWGLEWGNNGYFEMSYDYIVNPGLCADFWIIKLL